MPFNGIYNLRDANEKVNLEPWQLAEIKKCTIDPIYFIRNYVYINTKDHGMQLMKTYPFQDEAIKRFLKYRFNINRWSRQVGKSTVVRAFILWYAMFHKDQLVAMLANKLMLAKEQLQLLRDSYLALPYWLQPGVKLWNKMSIQFSNGCRIIIAASSPDGIRGFSPNLLYLDEFAFLRPNMADEFMASVFPSISSGKRTRVIITSCVTKDTMVFTPDGIRTINDFIIDDGRLLGYEVPEYQVLGRYGMNKGKIMHNDGHKETKIIKTRYTELECSLMHKWWICRDGEYTWKRAHELKVGDYVMVKYAMNCWGDDYIGYKHIGNSNTRKCKNTFGNIDYITPDIAYLFGLYIAEGNINDHTGNKSLHITIGDDISDLFNKYGFTYYKRDNFHYQISSADLVSLFKFVGFDISLHAKQKVIPPRLMRLSKKCTAAMIQGMMDGDGSANTNRCRITYTSTSHQLIKQLRMLLLNFGILSTLCERDVHPTKKVNVWSHVWTLEISSSAMVSKYFDEIGFRLDRKTANREKQAKHSQKAGHYDIIPFSAPVIRRLKKSKVISNDVFKLKGGICREGQEHLSRNLILDIKSKLPIEITEAEPIFQNAEPDCCWCPITHITDGEADVFDFSLNDDNYGGYMWSHSVIYNGNTGFQTPAGMNHFYRMWEDAVDEATATEHDLEAKYVKSTVLWNEVPGREEQWGIDEKARLGEQRFRQEYECEFIGSAVTLIDFKVLQKLKSTRPMAMPNIPEDYQLRIFSRPENIQKMEKDESTYIASLDTGYGIRQDYHVLQILLAKSSINVEQVLVLSSNSVPVEDFCAVCRSILKMYHNPPLTIEYNGGSGARAYQCMFNNLEYDNLVNYDQYFRGMYSTNALKNTAVMLLKLYVQRFYLKMHDEKTIMELMSYTKTTKSTWGASGGNHDDHVTSLFWAIYYAASDYFTGKQEEIAFMDALEITFAGSEVKDDMQKALEYAHDPDAIKEQRALGEMMNQRQVPTI